MAHGEVNGMILLAVSLLSAFRAFDEAQDEAWEPFLLDDV